MCYAAIPMAAIMSAQAQAEQSRMSSMAYGAIKKTVPDKPEGNCSGCGSNKYTRKYGSYEYICSYCGNNR